MFQDVNPNPLHKRIGDCTVRAIALAEDKSWDETFVSLFTTAFAEKGMPSENAIWGKHLKSLGYQRHTLPDTCPECYTVQDFAREHPEGSFIVACDGHVVCVKDGDWLDTWDSGDTPAFYYWTKEEA